MRDLLVAGGGPSGLATAILAAQSGLRTTIIEPRPGVIDKACGEGLMPPAVRSLQALGVRVPHGHPFRGIRYLHRDRSVAADFPHGAGLGVRRTALHAAMLDRVNALGIEQIEARVGDITQRGDHVRAAGLDARWLVAADGMHSPIRKQLGLQLPPLRRPRAGIRQHYACAPWSDEVEVHWAPGAEAYVTPVGPDLVGVAMLFDAQVGVPPGPGRPFDRLLSQFPHLQARLPLTPCTTARGAGPFEQRVRSRVSGRTLLVGDAAGYLDPLTGEGLRLGFAAARAAVEAILSGTPNQYDAQWRRVARRYWWMTSGLLLVTRPRWARAALVPVLQKLPWVMRGALGALGG